MKKTLSLVLAAAMVLSFASMSVSAAGTLAIDTAYDSDGVKSTDVGNLKWNYETISLKSDGATSLVIEDRVTPGSTFYIPLGSATDAKKITGNTTANSIYLEDLVNTDYFKFDVDKDANSKLVKKISVVSDKAMNGMTRTAYLKVELNDSTTTDELKTSGTITFKAKANLHSYTGKTNKPKSLVAAEDDNKKIWLAGNTAVINYRFWVNNVQAGNDDNPGEGDKVFMKPDKNDTNTITWGEDRAALTFDANDDASKFYCKLSTSNMSDVYAEYGDPVDADLWFYDFASHPTVPSTSRATLTLGVPWEDDENIYAAAQDCFIYEYNDDGTLTDVTANFSYSEEAAEIPGWSTKTRTLGTYIVSDTELVIEVAGDVVDTPEVPTVKPDKDIPNTGSSDMVNVAVVAAVVSLAAAGAVAFRKMK